MEQINRIIFMMLVCVIFFTGCVEEEAVTTTEIPTPTVMPEETVSTPTPTPMPTVEVTWKPDVTLKPGYKWFQNDEYGYGFAYPEEWEKPKPTSGSGMINGVALATVEALDSGFPEALVMVMVYSKPNDFVFWEDSSGFIDQDGLEIAKEMRVISKYGNTTINGRTGFEVVYDPKGTMFYSSIKDLPEPMNPTWTQRTIIFTIDDRDYIIMASSSNEFYNKHEVTYEDIINSYVIKE